MAQSPKISPKWGRVVTSCNSGCGIKAMTFGSTAPMAQQRRHVQQFQKRVQERDKPD